MAKRPPIKLLEQSDNTPEATHGSSTQWAQMSEQFDACRIHYQTRSGKNFEELYWITDSILLRTVDSEPTDAISHDATNLAKHITFAYKLNGNSTISHSTGLEAQLTPGLFLLGYSDHQENFIDYTPKDEPYTLITLAITPQALLLPPLNLPVHSLPESIIALFNGEGELATILESFQSNHDILTCLQTLLTCQISGPLRTSYIQSKAYELICLTLDRIKNLESQNYQHTASHQEQQQLEQVQKTLSEQYHHSPSISELSKQIGMSESKLKKSFKQFYGMTIGEQLQQLRMSQAQTLLGQHNKNISQIANELGYEHASNFITAFKRHFGLTPKAYQKQNFRAF